MPSCRNQGDSALLAKVDSNRAAGTPGAPRICAFGPSAGCRTVFRLVFVAALLFCPRAGAAPGTAKILVVAPDADARIEQALGGVKIALADQPVTTRFLSLVRDDALDVLRTASPETVFLGIGQRAADEVLRWHNQASLIACLAQEGAKQPRGDAVIAIPAEVSPELQATWIRRLHTQARRVGLLYDPDFNARPIARLAEALQRVGLQPLFEPVRAPRQLPEALQRLGKRADVILGVNDRTVFTPQTAKAILLHSFRARIPLIGLSDAWVKAGALYALEPDYADLGKHCGLAALRRTGLSREFPQQPARLVLSVNLRTAKHMRIDWPSDILHMARKTHE